MQNPFLIHVHLAPVFTWDKQIGGIEPVKLQVKSKLTSFNSDQDDQVDHWKCACVKINKSYLHTSHHVVPLTESQTNMTWKMQ